MRLGKYLRDKWLEIIFYSVFGVLMSLLLFAFNVESELSWLFGVLYFILVLGNLSWNFARKRDFYNRLQYHTEQLDQKYLVLETLEQPDFYEGEILYQNIYDVNKSMCEHVKEYQESLNDFKDYLEMWVHEAKLPIASQL